MRLPDLYIGQRRPLFLWLLLNGLGQGLLAIASAWLVKTVFDAVSRDGVLHPLLFAAFGVAVVARALLRRQEQVHAEMLGQGYVRAVRSRLFSRLLDADLRQFRRRRKGALLMKFVGDLSALRRWISLGYARLLVSAVTLTIGLAALFWLHWSFALGIASVLAATAAWILRFSPRLRAHIAEARSRQASLSANVTEKLAGLAAVQAFDQGRRERRRLRRQAQRVVAASVGKAGAIGTLRGVIDATSGACVAVLIGIACLLPAGELSTGVLAAAISIVGFLAPRLRDLGRAQEYWLAAQVARRNLSAVGGRAVRLRRSGEARPLAISAGEIRFQSVTVDGVLHAVDLLARPGAKVALTGANGSGKSTLLGLVGRLFDPDAGNVLIDGQDVSEVTLASLRRQVAYVSADVPLLRGSLKKNLCYGAGRVTREELLRVVSDCGLDQLVAHGQGGLAMRIAENGANLSQGERVRVALARALLCKPAILLLDEADANLDLRAIRALNKVLGEFAGTAIVASHRHSSMPLCDTVWTLLDGGVQVSPATRAGAAQTATPASPQTDVAAIRVARA